MLLRHFGMANAIDCINPKPKRTAPQRRNPKNNPKTQAENKNGDGQRLLNDLSSSRHRYGQMLAVISQTAEQLNFSLGSNKFSSNELNLFTSPVPLEGAQTAYVDKLLAIYNPYSNESMKYITLTEQTYTIPTLSSPYMTVLQTDLPPWEEGSYIRLTNRAMAIQIRATFTQR